MKGRAQISVVMPVHNAAPFLNQSIESVLQQTFSDLELVILDDGSTDGSADVLRTWQKRDGRIRLYSAEEKLGLSGSSNFVVSKARAPLIARMDADDISHPERLQRQFDVMQKDAEVVAVGTLCNGINAIGEFTRPRDRWRLVRRSAYIPFPHGSAMFRRSTFDAIGGYREHYAGGEDQDIFYRMTQFGRVVTLPDVLYSFRYHTRNSSLQSGERGVRAVIERSGSNGNGLSALYLLGAMRLWAGERPEVLQHMLEKPPAHWDFGTVTAIAASSWGDFNPASLRVSLRLLIRARDLLAGLVVKDGRTYEWRLK